MSYGRVREIHSGVGAIAAMDGVSRARARAQQRKRRVMSLLDRRNARLAHGPGRALPVPMGALSITRTGMTSGPTISSGGSIEVPPLSTTQPTTPTTPPTPGGGVLVPIKTRPIGVLTTVTPTIAPTSTATGTGLTPPRDPVVGTSMPTPIPTPIPTPTTPLTPTTVVTPTTRPIVKTPTAPTGGGGGSWTWPTTPTQTFTEVPEVPEVPELGPPTASPSSPLRTVALLGAALLGLYLLTQD